MQTEFDDPNSERAALAFERLSQTIDAMLGPGENVARLEWHATSNWTGTKLWERNRTALAIGGGSYGDKRQHNRLAAVAYGGAANMEVRYSGSWPRAQRDACYAGAEESASRLDQAVTVAAVGGAVEARIRDAIKTLRQKNYCEQHPTSDEGAAIADAVIDFVAAAATLPTARRAAAFVAADGVLSRSGVATWGQAETPEIKRRLEAKGAHFDWGELGGGYTYTHDWLKAAQKIDPNGNGGELAFLMLMRMGFHTGVGCAGSGTYGFETVIEEGTRYLRTKPNSAISREIHLHLAHAYGDIVGLAGGLGYDPDSDAEMFRVQSESARAKALEHYRIVFGSDPQNADVRSNWPTAWRLAAGLPPTRTRFYCVYD